VGDDERMVMTVDQQSFLNLDPQSGSRITGLSPAINGVFYAFKRNHIYRIGRTGLNTAPYRPTTVSTSTGTYCHKSIVSGEDQAGSACLYFLDTTGPYRLQAQGGLEYLGKPIQTLWETVNVSRSENGSDGPNTSAVGVYHPRLRQVWWYVATGAQVDYGDGPSLRLRYAIDTGAWMVDDGLACQTEGAVLYSQDMQAKSWRYTPWVAKRDVLAGEETMRLMDAWDETVFEDEGRPFQAYAESKPFKIALGRGKGAVTGVQIVGEMDDTPLEVVVTGDFGRVESRRVVQVSGDHDTQTLQIAEVGSELPDVRYVSLRVGDPAPASSPWAIHALTVSIEPQESL
jgi:hypothetical protein